MERLYFIRNKEKENKMEWDKWSAIKDLKFLFEEPEFDYKEYFKEVLGALVFIGFSVLLFLFFLSLE